MRHAGSALAASADHLRLTGCVVGAAGKAFMAMAGAHERRQRAADREAQSMQGCRQGSSQHAAWGQRHGEHRQSVRGRGRRGRAQAAGCKQGRYRHEQCCLSGGGYEAEGVCSSGRRSLYAVSPLQIGEWEACSMQAAPWAPAWAQVGAGSQMQTN